MAITWERILQNSSMVHSKNMIFATRFIQSQRITHQQMKMARELQDELPTCKASEQLLGCIAHVIDLGAKAGLGVLGSLDEDNCHEISMTDMDQTSSDMSISNLTSEPDGCGLDYCAEANSRTFYLCVTAGPNLPVWKSMWHSMELDFCHVPTIRFSEATDMLCASRYPSLNKALPVYIVLMKHLKRVVLMD
ncbi:uncharacterized protein VP01_1892g1 [Puccinia sorghi]|uniref:Uncharacterized protein n=1 Tax=Puccinia sorghi TaxID=27349 RepID=A0A0L6VEU3_9BASI|nr:uncharacterized protein VP01_1892g1 [Puccinia sorghi]